MSTLALATFMGRAPARLGELFGRWTAFLAGIEDARALAQHYAALSELSDTELGARGLAREEIPQAVLATLKRT